MKISNFRLKSFSIKKDSSIDLKDSKEIKKIMQTSIKRIVKLSIIEEEVSKPPKLKRPNLTIRSTRILKEKITPKPSNDFFIQTPKHVPIPPKSLPIRRREKKPIILKSNCDTKHFDTKVFDTKHFDTKKVSDKKSSSVQDIDPILKASIYLDFSKNKPYNYVSERMKSISKTTSELRNLYKTELKELPNLKNNVTQKQFDLALSVYENNQVYYQDRIDDKSIDLETIKNKLTELEKWFININEPKQKDDIEAWSIREKEKIKGISSYCDPELYSYIKI